MLRSRSPAILLPSLSRSRARRSSFELDHCCPFVSETGAKKVSFSIALMANQKLFLLSTRNDSTTMRVLRWMMVNEISLNDLRRSH
jgi:hypothetical protein